MAAVNPAETYESYMVPALFGPWAEALVRSAEPKPGERLLDVACGTGVVARRAAANAGPQLKVTGIDLSAGMLKVARDAAEREGLTISWDEGAAERLPYADGSFDLATCQFALMFFADREAALTEMFRVLVEGGRAALSVWQPLDRHPFYQTLHASIQKRLGMSGVGDIFGLGDAGELNDLLARAGFHDIEIEPQSITARFPDPAGFLAGEIDVDTAAIPSMQHLDAKARAGIVAAIRDDMEDAMREVTEGDHIVMPFHALLVRAHR
jgi:ubiquinone/menaquinone biosynthesis C-methylase UbiE